jgi:hypothetical protein
MDDSFEDPGTFDEDGYDDDGEEGIDGEAHLDARPAPDLNGLLSVSPLVRFGHRLVCVVLLFAFSCWLRRRACKAREKARRRSKGSALPVVTFRTFLSVEPEFACCPINADNASNVTTIAEDIYKQMIAQRQSREEQYSTKLP